MNKTKSIIVVCEGPSEWIYLQRLNSFLSSLPFPDGWMDIPIRFIGKPPKAGVGTGKYNAVEKEIRSARKQNRSQEIWAWVDADLYVRNDKACGDNYRNRPKGIPPFDFSIFNFEDFLALHLDEPGFLKWTEVMTTAGHFNSPLHWDDYKVHYAKVMPGYKKADLPVDFITLEALGNLNRHLSQMPAVDYGELSVSRTFAHSMLKEISRWYAIPGMKYEER